MGVTVHLSETQIGLIMWAIIFYPVWSPRMIRLRRQGRRATRSTEPSSQPVSRNRQTGPAWEQDEPYIECFVDTERDDLDG